MVGCRSTAQKKIEKDRSCGNICNEKRNIMGNLTRSLFIFSVPFAFIPSKECSMAKERFVNVVAGALNLRRDKHIEPGE